MSGDSNDYSFESILAEVKGTAFINGDKKTPPDLLQEKADRILREAAEITVAAHQTAAAEPEQPAVPHRPVVPVHVVQQTIRPAAEFATGSIPHDKIQQAEYIPPPLHVQQEQQQRAESEIQQMQRTQTPVPQPLPEFEPDFSETDDLPMIVTPLDNEAPAARVETSFAAFDSAMDEVSAMNARQSGVEAADSPTLVAPIREIVPVKQTRSDLFDQDISSGEFDETAESGESYGPLEEEIFEEPQLKTAVRRFASACNSISIRVIPASVITLFMVVITYVYEAGLIVPFGIGHSLDRAAGALIVLLLIVMMLCVDVIVRGVDFLIKGTPNAETLILFSCLFSIISAIFTIMSDAAPMLPFCAVSALSLTFATHGEKFNLRAITDTLKTAAGSTEPYGVQAEYNLEIDKSVLKKAYNRIDGFYNNLIQPDITELIYRYAAPVLLVSALVLTLVIVIFRRGAENSLHILSALLAAAAPFSLLLSFSVPFAFIVRSTRRSGAAVAGWGGADDIWYTDGVCVTDDDLFPPGMLKLSGVKVYDGASPENAIKYTASLIMSSGSGLTGLFSEVLKQQGLSAMRVDNFECHESGIGAVIRGENVSTGSAAFMNLLGVRVPDDTNMKNAVYTAINNRLVAMFAIDYKPLPSVQSALISMLKWRIDLYFAMRDFNVTPAMVGQKFKVPFESFVFIPAKDSYSISDLHAGKAGRMAAVLIREGLNPFAEAITGGRLLKSAAFFATILSLVSAALGVLIMFYMCWTGAFQSASPGNLVIFMLCMMATVLIVCGYVRLKK